jgi:hypothetical protein
LLQSHRPFLILAPRPLYKLTAYPTSPVLMSRVPPMMPSSTNKTPIPGPKYNACRASRIPSRPCTRRFREEYKKEHQGRTIPLVHNDPRRLAVPSRLRSDEDRIVAFSLCEGGLKMPPLSRRSATTNVSFRLLRADDYGVTVPIPISWI